MNGILLVDKPKGWTSFDAVNKVRRVIENSGLNQTGKKRFPVGHTGTLDPLATGLLVLVLGNYTKRAGEFTKLDKTYEVKARLGYNSTTGDEEGEKHPVSARKPDKNEVKKAVNEFVGEIEQTPPAYSAVKIGGQRAYKLARKGKEVKLEPRKVKVYEISGLIYQYPYLEFNVSVSSGTFIRSLVEDIGKKLGTGAYTVDLKRTEVGKFNLKEAINIDGITGEQIYNSLKVLA